MFHTARSVPAHLPRPSASPKAYLCVESLESRLVPYALSGNAWANPQLVTISFVPDGTDLGGVASNLFANFNARWATAIWQNQILKAAQVWGQQTNLNFALVTDSGAPIGSGSYQQGDPTMGDIRIGGFNFNATTLATIFLPPPANTYSIAGDMQFNTGQSYNIGNTYDLFTVAAHEFGHALGLLHSMAGSPAVMWGSYTTRKTALYSDDIQGIQAIYGSRRTDAYDAGVGDNSFQTAADISGQINTSSLTASLNKLDITTTSDVDYYTFTTPSGATAPLTVKIQSKGLSLLAPTLTLYAADQTTVLASASGACQFGTTLTVTSSSSVSAGQRFYVKVAGADSSAFGTGAYGLSLSFSTSSAPTIAVSSIATLAASTPATGGGAAFSPRGHGHSSNPGNQDGQWLDLAGGNRPLGVSDSFEPNGDDDALEQATASQASAFSAEADHSRRAATSQGAKSITDAAFVLALNGAAPMTAQSSFFTPAIENTAQMGGVSAVRFGGSLIYLPALPAARSESATADEDQEPALSPDAAATPEYVPPQDADAVRPEGNSDASHSAEPSDTLNLAELHRTISDVATAGTENSNATRASEQAPVGAATDDGTESIALAGMAALALGGFRVLPGVTPRLLQNRLPIRLPDRERRRAPRFPCYLGAFCRQVGTDLCGGRAGVAQNLSGGGVCLRLSRPFLPGSQLIIELERADRVAARWLLARVVHVSEQVPGEWMLGCAFKHWLSQDEVQTFVVGDLTYSEEMSW